MPRADRRQVLISFVATLTASLSNRESRSSDRRVTADTDAPAAKAATAEDWQSVIEVMFPHSDIDRSLYSVPAEALILAARNDANTRLLLHEGWLQLNRVADNDWASATPRLRTQAIASLAGTPLFTLLRQTTVFTFYGDSRVWRSFGYEGDAWRFGGYQGRVNTIDWLPDPPAKSWVTE